MARPGVGLLVAALALGAALAAAQEGQSMFSSLRKWQVGSATCSDYPDYFRMSPNAYCTPWPCSLTASQYEEMRCSTTYDAEAPYKSGSGVGYATIATYASDSGCTGNPIFLEGYRSDVCLHMSQGIDQYTLATCKSGNVALYTCYEPTCADPETKCTEVLNQEPYVCYGNSQLFCSAASGLAAPVAAAAAAAAVVVAVLAVLL